MVNMYEKQLELELFRHNKIKFFYSGFYAIISHNIKKQFRFVKPKWTVKQQYEIFENTKKEKKCVLKTLNNFENFCLIHMGILLLRTFLMTYLNIYLHQRSK